MVRVINFACDKRFEIVETGNDCSRGGEWKTPKDVIPRMHGTYFQNPQHGGAFQITFFFFKRMLYDDIES